MINCKKYIIVAGFVLAFPLNVWSEAPVIDDSEHFAQVEEGQGGISAPSHSTFDESIADDSDRARDDYSSSNEDNQALAKEDRNEASTSEIGNNAKLVDKILSLQQELQELRGQIEVQAHDLKLLQQQQLAFYKDLDTRLGGSTATLAPKNSPREETVKETNPKIAKNSQLGGEKIAVTTPVSRINPADEQISYLAAYELIKNKQYEEATRAMEVFVQKYPKGGYSSNAQYWLGELYMVKKQYQIALQHFEIVLHQFPASSKAAASLLKAGYAYSASGNNEEAKKRLQQVIANYPGTPTAQLAGEKLKAIN